MAGVVLGASAARLVAQQPAPPPQAAPTATPPDVVVEGRRDTKRLQGGQWQIDISRAYAYGRVLTEVGEARSMGQDRTWRFCLKDTDVEPLVQLLVGGQGALTTSTGVCTKLDMRLGDGKLRGDQTCTGASMARPSREVDDLDDGTTGAAPALIQTIPARDLLTISGKYDLDSLSIDFDSRREPMAYDPSFESRPVGRRWSIRGKRLGECPAKP